MAAYEFTNNWFEITARAIWDSLIPQINLRRMLEIGSYEGASACYIIEKLGGERDLEIHCIDTWQGGIEHGSVDMSAVEARFDRNLKTASMGASRQIDVHKHKMSSDLGLAKLIAAGESGSFDFVYVDGSHQAPDVLLDAVLGFRLLRIGGVMAFDDYLWHEGLQTGIDHLRCPKPAVDAFVNLHIRKVGVINAPLGAVDKVDSQTERTLIQVCLLGDGHGSRLDDGPGMEVFRAFCDLDGREARTAAV